MLKTILARMVGALVGLTADWGTRGLGDVVSGHSLA